MLLDKLIKSIYSINHDGDDYVPNSVEIKEILNKYSSSGLPTMKLVIDKNLQLSRNDKVSYICPTCQSKITMFVGKFLLKNSLNCRKCKEQVETKKMKQSEYLKKSFKDFSKIQKQQTKLKVKYNSDELIVLSKDLFENESDEFKKDYLSKIPNISEFSKIKDYINKIDGIDIKNKKIEYHPIIKNNNQMKYSPKVLIDDEFHNLDNCEFECQNCSTNFRGRNILDKSKNGVLCKECSFSNKTFKFKFILNIKGEKVVYQSKPELKLIKHYNNNQILITNGPNINYIFNGKKRIYRVDFMIPSNKMLIEVKDNHKWHRDEMISGKWKLKEDAARTWCVENNYTYHLIFNVDVLIKN